MKIKINKEQPLKIKGDMIVFCVRKNGKKTPKCPEKMVQKQINKAFASGDFTGKDGQTILFYPDPKDACGAERVMIVGLGEDEITGEVFRLAGGMISRTVAKSLKAEKIMIVLPDELDFPVEEMCQAFTEGVILGDYKFNKYKKAGKDEEEDRQISLLTFSYNGWRDISAEKDGQVELAMQRGMWSAGAVCQARDMANEPGNKWTPEHFAKYGRNLAKDFGLKCTILGAGELKKLKMAGILAVNQGTAEKPKLVMVEYRTGRKVPTLMLVGKGLTFDSGGISLKPGAGMQDMKYDMCGGAAVLTAMRAIAQEAPDNIDVVALVPSTDNMPGPEALKPGDIIRQHNGKTVEIISTDAEGRLILADALSYGVKRFKPDAVIDLATLTGAVIIGLGHHTTGLMSNDDKLAAQVTAAGDACAEPVWRLPLGKEYTKQIKSKVADLKNVGGRDAGTITAGAFLQEFVGDVKWAHLDIAGTAWDFTDKSYIPKGPSGVGVRLLLELIRNWQ